MATHSPIERDPFTGLIFLTGFDAPGIAEKFFTALADFTLTIVDVEQIVIRDRLILTTIIELDPNHAAAIESDLDEVALQLGVDIGIAFTEHSREKLGIKENMVRLTLVGNPVKPNLLALVSAEIFRCGGNIERILRTSDQPFTALEILISEASFPKIQSAMQQISRESGLAVAVHPLNFINASKKFLLFDMDSTLIQEEVIDLLAKKAGVGEEVATITAAAMRGEIDFEESLRARTALLKGLPTLALLEIQEEIHLSAGAKKLIQSFQKLGHGVGVVSGGFMEVIAPIMRDLNIVNFRANSLVIEGDFLTGELQGPMIDGAAKARALQEFAAQESVAMEATIAIGDGANDREMVKSAGWGIAFNAKAALVEVADTSISGLPLDCLLSLMGILPDNEEGERVEVPRATS